MISALKNSGVKDLKEFLLLQAKEGPWYFDPNDQTDMPIKFNLAEILREKLFLRLHQEIPYCKSYCIIFHIHTITIFSIFKYLFTDKPSINSVDSKRFIWIIGKKRFVIEIKWNNPITYLSWRMKDLSGTTNKSTARSLLYCDYALKLHYFCHCSKQAKIR